jgi:hypothetical protein
MRHAWCGSARPSPRQTARGSASSSSRRPTEARSCRSGVHSTRVARPTTSSCSVSCMTGTRSSSDPPRAPTTPWERRACMQICIYT